MTNHPAPKSSRATDVHEEPFSLEALNASMAERRTRVDGWSTVRASAFIELLSQTGSVAQSAEYVGMSVNSAYRLRARPDCAAFADAWNTALATRHEALLDAAMQRTREGTERTRWFRGEVAGHERVFSDQLLMFMIDRTDPSRGIEGRAVRRGPKAKAIDARAVPATHNGAAEPSSPVRPE